MKIKKTILVINLTFFHIISSDGLSIFFKNNAFIIKNKKETIKKICLNPLIIQPSIDKYFEDREKLLSNKEFLRVFI